MNRSPSPLNILLFRHTGRRGFIALVGAAAVAWPLTARSQQAERSIARPRVAFLGAESASTNDHFFDAFRQGMTEHGYIDGQNVILDQRWAEGWSERFPELVGELISLKSDVIVVVSLPAAFAGKNETRTLPIVFIASDPLGSGLVPSLARLVEGKNVVMEFRWARGDFSRLPAFAAELVRKRMAVIVAAGGDVSGLAAKAATSPIPIVFGSGDPIKSGLVASLNRPGGNATGVYILANDLESKRLGLLHELFPGAALFGLMSLKAEH